MPNCLVCLDFWEDQFEPRKGKKKKKKHPHGGESDDSTS